MLAARVSRLSTQGKAVAAQSRNMSVISGPPMERISAGEKAVHGMALVVGTLAIPIWVLLNLKSYKGQE